MPARDAINQHVEDHHRSASLHLCDGQPGTVTIRLRGVDTDERGQHRWREAREELRRRTAGHPLAVRRRSHRRVVADVLAGGVGVGAAMDAAGWSKQDCPKR